MTIDATATPLGANPPTDQHPATAPSQGIVHLCTARRHPHRWPAHSARRRRPDNTERARTNSDDDGPQR
ncbi:MAG: hypothetical protein QOD10_338 [Mycobacterium sp.]|jgi:hypothetical protein|nr:hypothetical protein [Mycobacterium sp.]